MAPRWRQPPRRGAPVSGDPLDLDAAESLAREMADSPWLTVEDLDDLREVARSALVLVAEVRRLRADRLEAKREALREARAQATWPLATAEQWRYDRILWIFDVMLGEIPEDSLAPPSPGEPGFAEAYPDHARLLGITNP